ncbi:hypothetical protein Ae201684P_019881 [Aphanomyces euteiches]|uniref:Uncharacterized protein n=1 Tax=Aphanomyces euteiches TaxID=100861 RepID=A0A6G0WBS7_9STRA|nr:hypothetical protein Ae201684_016652 [Aphanomyces euteiches]KAH9078810.1 hypothetical protein Ae201684P_019881 [Aphanomyces euteiches]
MLDKCGDYTVYANKLGAPSTPNAQCFAASKVRQSSMTQSALQYFHCGVKAGALWFKIPQGGASCGQRRFRVVHAPILPCYH